MQIRSQQSCGRDRQSHSTVVLCERAEWQPEPAAIAECGPVSRIPVAAFAPDSLWARGANRREHAAVLQSAPECGLPHPRGLRLNLPWLRSFFAIRFSDYSAMEF